MEPARKGVLSLRGRELRAEASFRLGAEGGELLEITGAGGSATRMFIDVAKRVPPGPPDFGLIAAALSDHGVSLVAP